MEVETRLNQRGTDFHTVSVARDNGRYLDLDVRSRRILDARFPEDGSAPIPRSELGREFDESPSSIKRLERNILKDLGKPPADSQPA